jgi:hypothetical protein
LLYSAGAFPAAAQDKNSAKKAGAPGENKSAGDGAIAIEGRLAQSTVKAGEKIHFWISLENRSGKEIDHLQLAESYTPGFTLPKEWKVARSAACPDPNGIDLAAGVPAGGSIALSGDLQADAVMPQQNLSVVLCWEQGGTNSRRVVQLGQAETFRWWEHPFLFLLGKPEVTIPATLTLLTLLAAWWARSHKERAQTWNTMLLETQKASMHYYMPATTAIGAAVRQLDAFRESNKRNKRTLGALKKSFYYMMRFQWIHQQTLREVGAYNLQSRTGEELLRKLYLQHTSLSCFYQGENQRKVEKVLALITKETSLDDFLAMAETQALDVGDVWKIYKDWAVSKKKSKETGFLSPACFDDMVTLEAYVSILYYEVNRPYLNWFGTLDPIELPPRAEKVIDGIVKQRENPALAANVRRYMVFAKLSKADSLGQWLRVAARRLWDALE